MVAIEPHPSSLLTQMQRRVVIAGMMGGVSLAAIDQMVLSTAVSSIAGELGNISQAPWIFSANLLTSASSMPIWGKLGDLYGRRRIFQIAISVFIIASLLASQADTMLELVICRAFQGLGGGALLTVPYAILGDIVPPRERAAYIAFITVIWTAAGFLGPPLGGFFVDGPGWRWMFYMNVPTALLTLCALQWGYRIPAKRIEHAVDYKGAALLFSCVGSLILYTSWAGTTWGWLAPSALAFVLVSAILGALFIRQERRAEEPILELSLLGRQAVWAPLLATCFFGFANFVIAIFVDVADGGPPRFGHHSRPPSRRDAALPTLCDDRPRHLQHGHGATRHGRCRDAPRLIPLLHVLARCRQRRSDARGRGGTSRCRRGTLSRGREFFARIRPVHRPNPGHLGLRLRFSSARITPPTSRCRRPSPSRTRPAILHRKPRRNPSAHGAATECRRGNLSRRLLGDVPSYDRRHALRSRCRTFHA